ncbi:DUF1538 domain-containing protein [Shewanella marinintestina]|uniref:DUF1538 domain-containing protein n=1 Tax=Shewanella marinintestina TaxID=190305 RepID=UPI00200F1E0D|nr:DUF1538 domain-containing protein [Shewanella marinintestina]MCL1146648.1 DUF1538 domain-containing protein [Shewanella marinintestina]
MASIHQLFKALFSSFKDLIPIILVVCFFELFVLQQAPDNLFSILIGLIFIVVGLTFFVFGLEMGLFPIGESLAQALARKGSIFWLVVFSFSLGFGTTLAEPALTAVANEAAEVAAEAGAIKTSEESMDSYAMGLRLTVALSVGLAILLGVVRILKGWPIHYLIISGYIIVMILTSFAPENIIGIAYDSGGVTTSTITVPLVTALGVGLATVIKGRNPMLDGFGLIAFASLMPMIFVLVYGMVVL